MKTTLDIPDALLKEAIKLSGTRTKTETVRLALEELIRQKRVEEIVASAGRLKFSGACDKMRHAR